MWPRVMGDNTRSLGLLGGCYSPGWRHAVTMCPGQWRLKRVALVIKQFSAGSQGVVRIKRIEVIAIHPDSGISNEAKFWLWQLPFHISIFIYRSAVLMFPFVPVKRVYKD